MASDANKKISCSIVRLNVGGKYFDTTRETLCASAFFIPWLEGRFEMAEDNDDRIFIDRDGHLFKILLSFMRSSQRPPQHTIDMHRKALLMECEFFQLDSLAYHLRGEISPYDMNPEDQAIQNHRAQLVDFFAVDHSPLDRGQLHPHMLLTNAPRSMVVESFDKFFDILNKFSDNLMDDLAKIPEIVIAGGAVIGSLVDEGASDLDIFLACEKSTALERLKAVHNAMQRTMRRNHGDTARLLVTRTLNAITFYQCQENTLTYSVPVQVILKVGKSVTDILHNFDVDCCCFGYIPSMHKLCCTPRGLRAVRYGANIVDSAFGGKNYSTRLYKYANRGFAVAIPGYAPELVRSGLLENSYNYFAHSGLLLRLGGCIWNRHSAMPPPNIMASTQIIPVTIHSGVSVKNLAKLIVLDQGDVILRDSHMIRTNAPICVPYRMHDSNSHDDYVVVEGKGRVNQAVVDDAGDDLYSSMTGEFIQIILDKVRRGKEKHNWITCGRGNTTSIEQRILCVYDLVKCDAPFEDLHFIVDARCTNNINVNAFEQRFQFPASLLFTEIGPRPKTRDFVGDVYD